ncbi:MAG: redoxin domain-containing protein [Pyrinomonadaceae bacterium]
MKSLFALFILLASLTFAFGQNEQSPIVEKEITYINWTYKNVRTDAEVNLRDFTKGKKLTMVVYYAPWCPNWRHDAPILQKLYDKYSSKGLAIIGVAEYDPVDSMKANLDKLNITFPAVYESLNRTEKQKTLHYQYRTATGDTRGWGSPWYIMLMPSTMEKKGDILTKKTFVINGEIIEAEGEPFIRKQLGLPAMEAKAPVAENGKIEVCDANEKIADLKKP